LDYNDYLGYGLQIAMHYTSKLKPWMIPHPGNVVFVLFIVCLELPPLLLQGKIKKIVFSFDNNRPFSLVDFVFPIQIH